MFMERSVSADPEAFREWLGDRQAQFQMHRFGNHRKYVSLDAHSDRGTGAAVQSYCEWILEHDDHRGLFRWANEEFGEDAVALFDGLYRNMGIISFGRMGKFDYLTMIGKLGLARMAPGSLYMSGATGPARGARLLFGGNTNADLRLANLDNWSVTLAEMLGVGAQEMEDALCNWQKSPRRLIRYRG
jgi:Alpha-glutamyl/putrescinyl thymine pyrophosphorylase clade 3